MIPLRLTVKNFMCYRDNVPALDLAPIHIACLCGENGHGKSALLDAITWALWGQARASSQDELIHQGRQDVSVELEFLARDQQYRVVRSHIRAAGSRQGKTDLNLLIASNSGFKSITANTVRETEARIRDLLQMDYETFINTAFLVQGRADLFTTANSSERKQRLSEVLGLSYYERLEERAKQRSRDAQREAQDAETALSIKRQEIERRPQVESDVQAINAEIDVLLSSLEDLRRQTDALKRKRDELQTRAAMAEELQKRLKEAHDEASALERRVTAHTARLSEYEALLAREQEIAAQFAAYQAARTESERLTNALGRMNHLSGERSPLEQRIAAEKARLQSEAAGVSDTIERELRPRAEGLAKADQELRATRESLARLEAEERALKSGAGDVEALTRAIAGLDHTLASLDKEMKETRNKFDLLGEEGAMCPVCRQPLGSEAQDHLRTEYETRGRQAKAEYTQAAADREAKKRDLAALSSQHARREQDLAQRGVALHRRIEGLERDVKQAREASEALAPALARLASLQKALASNDFAPAERRHLAGLDAKIAELGYDANAHKTAMARVRSLEQYADLHRKLQEAREGLPSEREGLQAAGEALKRRRDEAARLDAEREALRSAAALLSGSEEALAGALRTLARTESAHNEALRRQGALQGVLERCEAAVLEARGLEQQRGRLLDEKALYDDLERAFGRNGIPALIIEAAIPQLEVDANELLGRLTDGRMALKLELREGRKQKGVPTEALEIRIADEVGTRSYETFSGGEAFRINFALRIALSKLLARRSGAPLPILFVDEGFGSQDAAGQERLKESIQSIQNDFKKILVITHVEEMKDAFPVRIEVRKGPSGSTFTVT